MALHFDLDAATREFVGFLPPATIQTDLEKRIREWMAGVPLQRRHAIDFCASAAYLYPDEPAEIPGYPATNAFAVNIYPMHGHVRTGAVQLRTEIAKGPLTHRVGRWVVELFPTMIAVSSSGIQLDFGLSVWIQSVK